MAGSIVQSHFKNDLVRVITLTGVGDSGDGTFPATVLEDKIEGFLLGIETNPGTTAPTAAYDIALTDSSGLDILSGAGDNKSASATEYASVAIGTYHHPPLSKNETYTLAITNQSVNSADIVIKLFYSAVSG